MRAVGDQHKFAHKKKTAGMKRIQTRFTRVQSTKNDVRQDYLAQENGGLARQKSCQF